MNGVSVSPAKQINSPLKVPDNSQKSDPETKNKAENLEKSK